MRLVFMLNRRYAPYRKWLHRAFVELPTLSDDVAPLLTTMCEGREAATRARAFLGILRLLGEATNSLGIIEAQPLEGPLEEEHACRGAGTGFNYYGFATAIQETITGPLAKLAPRDGAPDQWAFDIGSPKPPPHPQIVRALFG